MDLNQSFSLELYHSLLRVRRIEEAIAKNYAEQKMRCPVHLSLGQEAIAVGVCKAALHMDYVFSNHRCHAHYLAKGGSLNAMIAELYGKKTGCTQGRGGSMHLVDLEANFLASTPIVGGTIPVAAGVAFYQKLHDLPGRVISFLGEGSTEEGVFCETLNFASLQELPILFVCENNFYSVYSPLEVRQPSSRDRLKIVQGHGIRTFPVEEGNDIEKVFQTAKEALNFIAENKKPAYIEFITYRTREHCGPNKDDTLNYRPKDQVEYFLKKCPLTSFQNKLLKNQILTKSQITKMEEQIELEIVSAFEKAIQAPFPSEEIAHA